MEQPKPWHPLRVTISILLGITLTIGIMIYSIPNQTDTDSAMDVARTSRHKRSEGDLLSENLWYQTMCVGARKVTNDSCYVCSLIPVDAKRSVPVITIPLNASEVLGAIIALGSTGDGHIVRKETMDNKINRINEIATSFAGQRVRLQNVSWAKDKITKPLFQAPPTKSSSQVCFRQECIPGRAFLGNSSNCNQTVPAVCGFKTNSCRNTGIPFVGQLNIWIPVRSNRSEPTNPHMVIPNTDGFGALEHHVWACGQNVYQILPPKWCGVCHMAKLLPNMRVVDGLTPFHTNYPHYFPPGKPVQGVDRRRRGLRISSGQKFASGILPWYGTVANAHAIDALAIDLENLMALMIEGFESLRPEIKALRSVTLQNRMALDFILASSGGVCHLVGRECCSFIPSISDNITSVIDHLNDLLHEEKSRDSPNPVGFNLWAWMTAGGWLGVLMKWVTPVIVILLSFMVLLCCVVPCLKMLIARSVSAVMGNYVQIPLQDHSEKNDVVDFLNEFSTIDSGLY